MTIIIIKISVWPNVAEHLLYSFFSHRLMQTTFYIAPKKFSMVRKITLSSKF